MRSNAASVDGFLAELAPERREALAEVRRVVLANLPGGYEEAMNWGMISYQVPLALAPATYNGKPLLYAGLASQKHHMALYLCSLYCLPGAEASFRANWRADGGKLDMGKSCIRFKDLRGVDLGLIGRTIAATPVAAFVTASRQR